MVRIIGISDATVTLQTEIGQILDNGISASATLPEDGVYLAVVSPEVGSAGGGYQIGLGYTNQPNPNDIVPTPLPEVVGVPTPVPIYSDLGAFITKLTNGETVGGTMDSGSPDHIYTFDGEAGVYIQLEMSRVYGGVNPRLTLYDPDGIPIAMDEDSAGIDNALLRNIVLPEDGVYTVQASGDEGGGGYSIRLLTYVRPAAITPTVEFAPTETPIPTYSAPTAAPAIAGNRLEDNIPVSSFIGQPGAVGIYPIYAAEGEILTIGVSPSEGSPLRPQIDVVDPEGVIVANAQSSSSNAGGDALIASMRAELEGTYNVFVTGEANTVGQYVISYGSGSTRLDVLQGEAIFDEPNTAGIAKRGLRDVWTVELKAGDIITATVNPATASQLDPILEIVSAENPDILIGIDDNSGGGRSPLIRRAEITQSGIYLLRVKAAQATTIGDYSLIWRYINVAPTPTPPPATARLLTLDDVVPDNEYRFYPFQGREGQRIQAEILGMEGFDPVAALIGPDNTILIEADDTNGDLNPRFLYELPADGVYNIRVNGYLAGGAFTLIVEELFQ
jgi:hypothetical protein